MINEKTTPPHGWLAFELNVLRRLEFKSIAIPFCPDPSLGSYLKRIGTKVLANDLSRSAHIRNTASIGNSSEMLSGDEVNLIVNDAYVPRTSLSNPALLNWFDETDAWWFDNVHSNIEKIASDSKRAAAQSIAMQVGDYVLSFDSETADLRQPLSMEFLRFWSRFEKPVENGHQNPCFNKTGFEFIAENQADLMFLRLPKPHKLSIRSTLGWTAWREEWIRRSDDFWNNLEAAQMNKLGTQVDTKSQYLALLGEMLSAASHIPLWSIELVEEGVLSTQDIVDVITDYRKVETVYGKDFSELTGAKAVIMTA